LKNIKQTQYQNTSLQFIFISRSQLRGCAAAEKGSTNYGKDRYYHDYLLCAKKTKLAPAFIKYIKYIAQAITKFP